jgi:hypothetical protein
MSTPADDTEYYRDALHQVIDAGLVLVRAIRTQVERADPDQPLLDPARAYDLASRAVRRTILLAQQLHQAPSRDRDRRRIIREVEDAIERCPPERRPALETELRERLECLDIEDEIGNRPLENIIQDICRDLGLAAVLGIGVAKRRTPADIAALCARAAKPPRPHNDPNPTLPFSPVATLNTG